MEKPNFIDFQENENINNEENDKNKVLSSKMSLPFLNVNIEKYQTQIIYQINSKKINY